MKKEIPELIITPLNIIQLANFLLNVDSASLKADARQDMPHFSGALQKNLDNFYKLPPRTGSRALDFDFHLSCLLESARNFYAVLTDDAKIEIGSILAQAEKRESELY